LIFALSCPLWSGTTGKIAGTIVDKKTGEPLPGAMVMVRGTTLGTAADLKGNYTILEVPPGTYAINVSMIGYAKLDVTDVRVLIDQTAHVNVNLDVEVLKGESVTIVAKRELVKPDVATSVVAVTGREIENLPVTDVQGVVGMQAGIHGMDIRGSNNAREALFMLDGVTLRDPRNNQPINKVALSAVKEISIERGGFTAEYGQVQSGIVNVVTNEGGRKGYSGSIMGLATPPAPKYYRGHGIPDVQSPNSYWMRPYFDPDVCWTGTLNGNWDQYTRSKYPAFVGWNEISRKTLTDNDPNNDLTPLAAQRVFEYETRKKQSNDMADYQIDAGFGGPVPFVSQSLGNLRFFTSYRRERDVLLWPMTRPDYADYDWTLVLNSDISKSMKLRVSGLLGNVGTMQNNWPNGYTTVRYMRTPEDIAGGDGGDQLLNMFGNWCWSLTDIGHRSVSAKLTHTLNSKTFYEVSLDYLRTRYNTRPTALRDTSQKYEIVPGYSETSNPTGYWPSANSSDGLIVWNGDQESLARDFSITSATTLKADFTSQLNFSNLMKAGVGFVYNDLDMDYGTIQMQTKGKQYSSRIQMHNYPIRAEAYIQDKLETKGFTMNAGLRFDYSDSKTDWWNFNPYDPYFISSKYNTQRQIDMTGSKAQWQISPRLGISHPITENSKLFFNYGHFKQMPQYELLYRLDRGGDNSLLNIGDPNLILEKTVSYELGYDHMLLNALLLQVTAFYRDISDHQNTTQYRSISGNSYYLTTSNTYQDVRGFELTLRKTTGRWFTGFANYTYQVTSNGNFGEAQIFQDPSAQQRYNENTVNLYQTRPVPAPFARANLGFYTPDDFGPALLRHNVLGGLMLNMLLDWNQGGWTTYNPKKISGLVNNVQYVDYLNGTVRASKTVSINHVKIQLLVDVTNLFNSLRLRDTGDQEYRLSLHLRKNKAYDNIPGNDKFGDYRKPGVEWQPVEFQQSIDQTKAAGSTRAIYYEGSTGKYWQYVDNQWTQVDQKRIDQINKDKAYINMPGPSTYWFLNPRAVIFGARVSFDLD
jgi:outer membrane receptor protein involved in Fe transport